MTLNISGCLWTTIRWRSRPLATTVASEPWRAYWQVSSRSEVRPPTLSTPSLKLKPSSFSKAKTISLSWNPHKSGKRARARRSKEVRWPIPFKVLANSIESAERKRIPTSSVTKSQASTCSQGQIHATSNWPTNKATSTSDSFTATCSKKDSRNG